MELGNTVKLVYIGFLRTAKFIQYIRNPIYTRKFHDEGPNSATNLNPGGRRGLRGLRRQPGRLRAQAHRVRQRGRKGKTQLFY